MKKLFLLNLPIVLPKIIGIPIIEGLIDDEVRVHSMTTYHPISQEQLDVISDDCQVNYLFKIDNIGLSIPSFTTIETEEIDSDLNILTRNKNHNSTYTDTISKVIALKRRFDNNVSLIKRNKQIDELTLNNQDHQDDDYLSHPSIRSINIEEDNMNLNSKVISL